MTMLDHIGPEECKTICNRRQ